MKITAFWNIAPRSLFEVDKISPGPTDFYISSKSFVRDLVIALMQYAPPKFLLQRNYTSLYPSKLSSCISYVR